MKPGNLLHVAVMLAVMAALLGLIGWILAGREGLLVTASFGLLFALFGRGASKDWMLKAIGARQLHPGDAPGLFASLVNAADIVYVHQIRGNGGEDTGATPGAGDCPPLAMAGR